MNRMNLFRGAALFALLLLVSTCATVKTDKAALLPSADVTLTVMHTNDVHSAFGGFTDKGLICYASMCEGGRGGYLRLDQAVRAVRKNSPNTLLLDAGDIFQGTLFWTQYKERMPMALIDKMGYQAIVPGNHEFDDGLATWLRLVDALKTPVLSANISFDPRPDSPAADKILPYTIFEQNGRKIGVVGLITETTPETASPGPGISFNDAQKALEKAVAELTARDVRIIIVLTHLGLERDRLLARTVDGVDIFVGGHSHSLLSNTNERAEGPYPVVEKSPSGAPVLVVTTTTACVYVGRLDVGFDEKGVATVWRGEPVFLDQAGLAALEAPMPNAELAELINGFAAPVMELMATKIGAINAAGKDGMPLEEPDVMECRRAECLSGNITADALRVVSFKDAEIALINGGLMRISLPGGAVTPGNILGTLPFQNTLVIAAIPGAVILRALEHGVSMYGDRAGRFLQVSGLRYTFNPDNAFGSRITMAEARDNNGQWQPLDENATYRVVSIDFLARGGDGFDMFVPLQWEEGPMLASDALRTYLERHSPVDAKLEGRITKQ